MISNRPINATTYGTVLRMVFRVLMIMKTPKYDSKNIAGKVPRLKAIIKNADPSIVPAANAPVSARYTNPHGKNTFVTPSKKVPEKDGLKIYLPISF